MFRVAGIEKNSIVDGEGWRYVIFFQGCNHKCPGCHNPETWDFNAGKQLDDNDIIQELNTIDPERFLDITLSGGDPFYQAESIMSLCSKLKELGYNIWAYTGFDFDDMLAFRENNDTSSGINKQMIELLEYIDVLVDGQFIISKRTVELAYRGSSNQRIIDVKESLLKNKVIEYTFED